MCMRLNTYYIYSKVSPIISSHTPPTFVGEMHYYTHAKLSLGHPDILFLPQIWN